MPETTNHAPAPREKFDADGFSAVSRPTEARPAATPARLMTTCVTSAVAAPAKTAPQETWLRATVSWARLRVPSMGEGWKPDG
ncbi:UNVERIFIED_ORG: hypothetical protein M2438_004036 [Methylobacterium sp. SuP10 SLI 274]|nr:hypothetical protein [Methylobacterium sp. SuP10 SLI 274]